MRRIIAKQPIAGPKQAPRILRSAWWGVNQRQWLGALLVPLVAASGCGTLGSYPQFADPPAIPDSMVNSQLGSDTRMHHQAYGHTSPAQHEHNIAPVVSASHTSHTLAAPQWSSEPSARLAGVECVESNAAFQCGLAGCSACNAQPGVRMHNTQEHIYDGGDQLPAAEVRHDWSAIGIDPTDTVIYYETLAGTVCVHPTNRVAIYAPRFGAVRQVTGAIDATRALGTERILAPIKPSRFEETNLAGTVAQPLAPRGEEHVRLIDAFRERTAGIPVDQVLPVERMSEARVPYAYVDLLGTGQITDEEIAVLGEFLQNARTWFVPENLEVVISGQSAALVKKTMQAQDVHVYELPDKCAMRICKAASHTIANSGDIVNFTIRFDNVGAKPLGNAVIVDSLHPRLEYIDGSQDSSVGARFSAEPNEAGSMILRWEIEEPVAPTEGGVISFDCLVR